MTKRLARSRVHWVAKFTFAPAYRWPDRGGWAARVRRWLLHTVLRYDGESCDACGRRVECTWWTTNEDWARAYTYLVGAPPTIRSDGQPAGGLLCMRCFSRGLVELGQEKLDHFPLLHRRQGWRVRP